MAKKKTVDIIFLQCRECNTRNYSVAKSKKLKEKFELKKHCKKCKKHAEHKEVKT
jgi:large subunit ribosomal protein L33